MTQAKVPTQEQVETALAAVLSSARFARSGRARELLTYLVTEVLAGRGEAIKAYSIAVDVFGKGADFDAENDTLVRVQAGRLRNLLDHYYASEGREADVIFRLPRGSYTLAFEAGAQGGAPALPVAAPPASETEAASSPLRSLFQRQQNVVLAAFVSLSFVLLAGVTYLRPPAVPVVHEADARRPHVIRLLISGDADNDDERVILHAVRDVASRFTAFDTVSREDRRNDNRRVWPEDYRIRIEKIHSGEASFVFLSAEHVMSGTVVGSERTSLHPGDPLRTALPIERALIKILQPLGPIYTDYRRRGTYSPVMNCVLLQQDYVPDQNNERHEKARACLEALVAKGVEDSRVYTSLSYLYREEFTDQRNPRPGDPLKRAIAASQRALELSPNDSEAHEQLMTVYSLTGDFDLMLATGRRAIELNPSNSAMHDNFAARLNYRGRYEEALHLLLRAEELQPVAPRWRAFAFFISYYGLGQMGRATERASTLAGTTNPLYIAARAIVARHRSDLAERVDALLALAREERGYLKNPRAMFERRQFNEALIDRLIEDLTAEDPPKVSTRQPVPSR